MNKKKSQQITLYFVEEGPGHGSENTKKESNSTLLNVSSFLSFWWMSWGWESQSTYKTCTKIEKEETHAHWKRARSALGRETTLELRQRRTTSREHLAWLDKSRKSEPVVKRDPTVLQFSQQYHSTNVPYPLNHLSPTLHSLKINAVVN